MPEEPESDTNARVRAIYGDAYAADYPGFYLAPWKLKHDLNLAHLDTLLRGLGDNPRWLDLACGQAWHFAACAGRARMLGVDLSEAQLSRARAGSPHAELRLADMTTLDFAPGSFDLVTNFWAGYCYLDDRARIAALWRAAVAWVAPGGALYVEVLLGADLALFNDSRFAQQTGFSVVGRSEDHSRWQYDDSGGRHLMTSPPLEDFLDLFRPAFDKLHVEHDGSFMVHVVCTGRH